MISSKKITAVIICLMAFVCLDGQTTEFDGQLAGWLTANYVSAHGLQTGIRYVPDLKLKIPLNEHLTLDGELSADTYVSYSFLADTSDDARAGIRLYRGWLRVSGERFEVRGGLQKINFGSASMLRPLMWFDRIDPRDPLKLSEGVYGLQGKYFFRNNANIWLWVLYGNKSAKGWETVPTRQWRPELGGRIQLPVPKGEVAFTYHNRTGEFPPDNVPPVTGSPYFPENRFGFDFKLDLGAGVWFEATVTHQQHQDLIPFTKAVTVGADYTFDTGNGLNVTAEHLLFNTSSNLLSPGSNYSFTGLSASLPVSVITRVSTILFYDWKGGGFYRFVNLSLTYDKISVNLIGFWNPDVFTIFNYGSGKNMLAGAGGQVMVVFNY